MSDASSATPAADRLIFFFSGFDPKGASFYHRLFREGAAARNRNHPDPIAVGKREREGPWASAWSADWRHEGAAAGSVLTRVHVMRWDDIVRRHWQRSAWQLARDYWNVYAVGIGSGAFERIRRKALAAFWLALFPLFVAVAAWLGGGALIAMALWLSGRVPGGFAVAGGAVAGLALWRVVVRAIDCEWLLRLYAFTRQQALGKNPTLESRQDEFADRIVETVRSRLAMRDAAPLREVMLVGHSTGSTLAASVLARALSRLELLLPPGAGTPSLSLLTLGHCIPIAADWGAASTTRAELVRLSQCGSLTWHDYSAPADWAAFSRTPPWPSPARLRGYQASPRFHLHLSAFDYAALRKDRRAMHLQYLRPPGQAAGPGGYDYFLITCGPNTLAERHALLRQPGDSPR